MAASRPPIRPTMPTEPAVDAAPAVLAAEVDDVGVALVVEVELEDVVDVELDVLLHASVDGTVTPNVLHRVSAYSTAVAWSAESQLLFRQQATPLRKSSLEQMHL